MKVFNRKSLLEWIMIWFGWQSTGIDVNNLLFCNDADLLMQSLSIFEYIHTQGVYCKLMQFWEVNVLDV